jgi:hypothetical protein
LLVRSEIVDLRAQIELLESEKDALQRQIGPCMIDGSLDVVQLTERLRNYDRLLRENIDMKIEQRFGRQMAVM